MKSPQPTTTPTPDWDALFRLAEAQSGYFTTAQAASVGYSRQLLQSYLRRGRVARVQRGIYRLVHFPASDAEGLVVHWLWSEQVGVFSHHTALQLFDLSDLLPSKTHMTVPTSWQARRLRVPDGLTLHYADLKGREKDWYDTVPVTNPLRTLRDCLGAHLSPEVVRDGIDQAADRGLIGREDARALSAQLDAEASA